MKKYWFAALLLTLFCLLLTGCSRTLVTYEEAEKYTAGGASIADSVRDIDLSWISGAVRIAYHPESTILLSESANCSLSKAQSMHWYLDGDTLRIRYSASGHVQFLNLNKQLTLTLPEDFRGRQLTFELTSADLTAPFLSAEEMEISLVSGNVTLTAEADRLKVDSVSGNQRLSAAVTKQLELNSVSGDVSLTAPQLPDACTIDTVSGEVSLTLPENASCTLRFSSLSGDMISQIPLVCSGKSWILGDGQADVSIETTSGDLNLQALAQ